MSSGRQHETGHQPHTAVEACMAAQDQFSAYLDGTLTGREMASVAGHVENCEDCTTEFAAWRDVQRSLGELGPAIAPDRLQARLRETLGRELDRGHHLPLRRRALQLWQRSLAPLTLRISGGIAAALLILGSLGWTFAAPIAVQANDDNQAHLVAPRYLYSQVPPQPIPTRQDVPIVLEAMIDRGGRVYDFKMLEGPTDAAVRIAIEQNLLNSVFKPAALFGVPVQGHLVLTFTGVSVQG